MVNSRISATSCSTVVRQRLIKPIDRRSLYKNLLLWVILFGAVFLLAAPLALHLSYALPTAKSRTIPFQDFSEERARDYYPNLTEYGPRVSNTRADYLTRAFLISQIKRIRSMASPSARFELSLQNFTIGTVEQLQNIAVRISSIGSAPNAPCLMLAAHYDSVEFSPGGSDDGAGVVTLLEIFSNLVNDRSITFSQVHLIVLFTTAEEMDLSGAKVFIYDHQWKNDIRRFINIDSTGGQEKAILFRVKPSQLVRDYARVPRPHANVIGDEILELIKSDTDYSVFTGEGYLLGYDFAFYLDGFSYHTSIDKPSTVESGALQHLGENTLVLSRDLLLGNVDIQQPETFIDDEHLIYFDVLGRHLIVYKKSAAVVVQSILIGLVVIVGIVVIIVDHSWSRRNSCSETSSFSVYFYFDYPLLLRILAIIFFFLCYLLSMCFGILLAALIAFITSKLRPLSWYGNSTLAFFLYGLPCLIGVILSEALWTFIRRWFLSKYPKKNPMELNTIHYINRCCFNFERHWALLLVFVFLMSVSIAVGARSLYLILLWAIFICPIYLLIILFEFVAGWLKKSSPLIFNEQGWYWLFAPYIVSLVPLIHTMEMTSRLTRLVIPMMGRSSFQIVFLQDLVVCCFIVVPAVIFFLVFIPNIQRTMSYARTLIILVIAFVIVLIIACARQPFTSAHPKIVRVTHASQTNYELTTSDRWPVIIPSSSRTASVRVTSSDYIALTPTLDQIASRTGFVLQNRKCSSSTACSFDDTFNRTMPIKELELTSLDRFNNYRFTFRHVPSYQIEVNSSDVSKFIVQNSAVKPRTETIVDVQPSSWASSFRIHLTFIRCDLQDSPFLQSLTAHLSHIVLRGNGRCQALVDTLVLTVNRSTQ